MSCNRVLAPIAILILFLAACTAGGEEPAVTDAANTATPESGLATVPPTEEGDGAQEEEATMVNERATTSAADEDNSDVIEPVEVDLSEITPEAPAAEDESGEAVEMPEPGRPNPQRAMVSLAKQDLADRLAMSAEEVDVVEVEEMEWRDSSLGCPAEDGAYLHVLTSGFRITLQAEGEHYDYHTDTRSNVVLCGPHGRPVAD